jgi:hypothetical protein
MREPEMVCSGTSTISLALSAAYAQLRLPWTRSTLIQCRSSQTRSTRSIAGCCSLPRSARRRQVAFWRPLPKERPQVAQKSISRIPEG